MTKKIKLKISARLLKKRMRKKGVAPKNCRFCSNKDFVHSMNYKNANLLKSFLTERGKILPSRISGNCCLHQRQLAREIRISRTMALMPYTSPMY